MPRTTLQRLIALLATALLGACAAAVTDAQTVLVCTDTENSAESSRMGDAPVVHGFVAVDGANLAFRPCNAADRYLVDTTVAIEDSILQHTPTGDWLYIRFQGREVECTEGLPDANASVVRIEHLVNLDAMAPAACR